MAHFGATEYDDGAVGPPDFPVSLGPFSLTAKTMLFWSNGQVGFQQPYCTMSHGCAVIGPAQACAVISSGTIVGTYAGGSITDGTHVLLYAQTGSPQGGNRVAVVDWDPCEWSWSADHFLRTTPVSYLALGSDTLQYDRRLITLPANGVTTTVSGLGFQPDYAHGMATENHSAHDALYSCGMSDGTRQRAASLFIPYISGTLDALSYQIDIGFLYNLASGHYWTIAFTADGYTITGHGSTVGEATAWVLVLHDPNGQFYVGDTPWASSATVTAPGFQPDFVIGQGAVHGQETAIHLNPSALLTQGFVSFSGPSAGNSCAYSNGPKSPGARYTDNEFDTLSAVTASKSNGAHTGTQPLTVSPNGFDISGGLVPSQSTPTFPWQYAAIKLGPATRAEDECVPLTSRPLIIRYR